MKTKNFQISNFKFQLSLSIVLISCMLISCQQKSNTNTTTSANTETSANANIDTNTAVGTTTTDVGNTITEEQAIEMALALPESQKIQYVGAFSNGISEDGTYYWIQVGNNMETHFATWYHFYVYITPQVEIKYYDVFDDEVKSLDQWRKEQEEL